MTDNYFQCQTSLAKTKSDFRCPEECDAPGCWMDDINVEVTLFDLVRLSLDLGTPISDLYARHCSIGLEVFETHPRYNRLLVKLKKPCPFLKKARCKVHDSKPLNCILFPEYHAVKGLLPDLAKQSAFSRFPCLTGEIIVSSQRERALKKLKRMGQREEALSCYFLFDVPSFIIDSKPLKQLLKKEYPGEELFTIQHYSNLVHERLRATGFFADLEKRVTILDRQAGVMHLFDQLKDDSLMESLVEQMLKPETVLVIKGSRVRRLKRYLQPPEVIFM